jgi:hypothetical protein
MWPILLIIFFTLLSGFGDAQGFLHSSRIWQDGRPVWSEVAKSMSGFLFGITMFWLALRWLGQLGVASAEVQTLLWFGVTIVGVALLSGQFARWERLDQVVAVAVLAGIGWLLFRTGG